MCMLCAARFCGVMYVCTRALFVYLMVAAVDDVVVMMIVVVV